MQEQGILLRGAMIYDAIHREPYASDIRVADGKIVEIGQGLEAHGERCIDAAGRRAYPGFVDAHSHIGLDSYGGPTGGGYDYNEMNDITCPELRGLDSYNPQDAAIPMALAAGVTTVCTGPGSANVLGGTALVVKLYGDSVDEAAILPEAAMKCAFGENPKRCYRDKCDSARMTTAAKLREALFLARDYWMRKQAAGDDWSKRPKFDMKAEALIPVLERKIPLKAHAHRADDILTALRIAREFDLRITIEYCTEGHLIVEELKKANAGLEALYAASEQFSARIHENDIAQEEERTALSAQGFAAIAAAVSGRKKAVAGNVQVEMHGITGGDDGYLVQECEKCVKNALTRALSKGASGKELKKAARDALLSLLWERTKTRPMTVVNLLDI